MKGIKFWQNVFVKDKDWPKRVGDRLADLGIKLKDLEFIPLYGGLRKICFRVKNERGDLVLAFWPRESLSREKIVTSLELEDWVGNKGILSTRRWVRVGDEGNGDNGGIIKIKVGEYWFWLGMLTLLPGKPLQIYRLSHIRQVGEALGRLHRGNKGSKGKTLLHLDFARSNLLFDENGQLCGVLDFEEARLGEPEEDLACTLSFLVEDNPQLNKEKIWSVFLAGYRQTGPSFDYDKMVKLFNKCLKERMKENNKELILIQAKRRLSAYQQQVRVKILGTKGLALQGQKYQDRKIVFVVGAFELLHLGHLEFLKKAKVLGDLLVVGVASDESRRRLKGEPYPLVSERTRAETLAHFESVDGVVIVAEDNVEKELEKLKPAIFYTAIKDWQGGLPAGRQGVRKSKEAELVRSWGGRVVEAKYFSPAIPSSAMVEKVALMKIKQVLGGEIQRQPLLKFKKEKKIEKEIKLGELRSFGEKLHRQDKKIVFTSLTADLFHLGHARFILKARSLGNVLVVGVPNNVSVRALKGPGRPIVDERARAAVLANLGFVDRVVIFDERTVLGCLQALKPDIFFTVKEDWNKNFLNSPEADFMKSIGGKIVRSERQAPYLSASKMIDKAAGELIEEKFFDLLKTARETPVLDADGFDPHDPKVQLAARERGFYQQVLAAVDKRGKCVFCDLKEKYLITEKNGVVLTVALFPYTDGHLLIIPRRHIESMRELNKKEEKAVFSLSRKGLAILKEKLGVESIWFLEREGKGIRAGKTVEHLHFHLIPYNPEVIKMGETKLKMKPIEVAKKLKIKNEKC